MKRNVKIAVIAFLIVIAINITVVMIGFADKSPASTTTPQPGVTATSTPAAEPTVTDTPGQTPAQTNDPTATSAPMQTGIPAPTSSSPTPGPTQTTAPTATQPGATPAPTSAPTATTTPTRTTVPTPTQTPTTTVSVSAVSQIKKGSNFSVTVNINSVSYMAFAGFDIKFDSSISYASCDSISQVGSGSGAVSASIIEPGLLRIVVDYSNYAGTNGGYGVSGSGYLCKLNFTAVTAGTSRLDFVSGQGVPAGELTLIRWIAWSDSAIGNVGWINSSITVVN